MMLNNKQIRTLLTLTSGLPYDIDDDSFEKLQTTGVIELQGNAYVLTDKGKVVVSNILDSIVKNSTPTYVHVFETKLEERIHDVARNITTHYQELMREQGIAG